MTSRPWQVLWHYDSMIPCCWGETQSKSKKKQNKNNAEKNYFIWEKHAFFPFSWVRFKIHVKHLGMLVQEVCYYTCYKCCSKVAIEINENIHADLNECFYTVIGEKWFGSSLMRRQTKCFWQHIVRAKL